MRRSSVGGNDLFQRGDPALPDHKIKIQPLVPKMFRDFASKIQPVSLPSNSWAPGTRSSFQNDQIKLAEKEIASADEELQKAKSVKQDRKAEIKKDTLVNSQAETFADGFETERPDLWKVVGTKQINSLTKIHISQFTTVSGSFFNLQRLAI